MRSSLSGTNTPFLRGFVFIASAMHAHELAVEISSRLVPCKGGDVWRRKDRDEVPSLVLPGVLGCDLELLGDPRSGFNLTLTPRPDYPHADVEANGGEPVEVDVSGILLYLLRDVPGVQVALG